MSPFAKSDLGRIAGHIAMNIGYRPSDLLEYDGSAVERLLLDAEIITEEVRQMGPPKSAYDTMMRRRAARGYPSYRM